MYWWLIFCILSPLLSLNSKFVLKLMAFSSPWISNRHLTLSGSNTELLLPWSHQLFSVFSILVNGISITPGAQATNLDINLDSSLSLIPHIPYESKSYWFHLQNISKKYIYLLATLIPSSRSLSSIESFNWFLCSSSCFPSPTRGILLMWSCNFWTYMVMRSNHVTLLFKSLFWFPFSLSVKAEILITDPKPWTVFSIQLLPPPISSLSLFSSLSSSLHPSFSIWSDSPTQWIASLLFFEHGMCFPASDPLHLPFCLPGTRLLGMHSLLPWLPSCL